MQATSHQEMLSKDGKGAVGVPSLEAWMDINSIQEPTSSTKSAPSVSKKSAIPAKITASDAGLLDQSNKLPENIDKNGLMLRKAAFKTGCPKADPRRMGRSEASLNTAYCTRWDRSNDIRGDKSLKFTKRVKSLKIFDKHPLVMEPDITDVTKIPRKGVRVDDYLAGLILEQVDNPGDLWPADFDAKEGMPRAVRCPLGHASKPYVHEGEIGISKKVCTKEQEGRYYNWWKGLHCLMGNEGIDAERQPPTPVSVQT